MSTLSHGTAPRKCPMGQEHQKPQNPNGLRCPPDCCLQLKLETGRPRPSRLPCAASQPGQMGQPGRLGQRDKWDGWDTTPGAA